MDMKGCYSQANKPFDDDETTEEAPLEGSSLLRYATLMR
jgi:hypothetical protein